MMSPSLQRAFALLEVHRYKEAQHAAIEALSENPDDVTAHLVIAQASLQLEQYNKALEAANTSISLAPDVAECYLTRARAYLATNKAKLARADCTQALELDPYKAETFGVLAWAHAAESHWREAIDAAEQGLELDPEETNCINARARSLMFLRQGHRAFEGIEAALARSPDDAYTHANAGWAKLQAGDREAALNHFTEALRLEPELEVAREGLIAAMKAKSPIYGALLSYTFFMTSLRPGMQFAVLVGAFIAYQITWRLLEANGYMLAAGLTICAWISAVLLTWAGDAVFNLLLLITNRGRQILSPAQKGISVAVASTLLMGFGSVAIFFYLRSINPTVGNPMFFIGIGFLLSCIPLSYAGRCQGKKLHICLGIYAGCSALLALAALLHFTGAERERVLSVRDLAIYALVAFSWIGPSILQRAR